MSHYFYKVFIYYIIDKLYYFVEVQKYLQQPLSKNSSVHKSILQQPTFVLKILLSKIKNIFENTYHVLQVNFYRMIRFKNTCQQIIFNFMQKSLIFIRTFK